MQKQHWLYVLKLQNDKFYIGKTARQYPTERIQQHIKGFYTAQWVRKYPFVSVEEVENIGLITAEEASKLEDNKTLQYMKKYGFNNVRGGVFNSSEKYYKIGDRYIPESNFKTAGTIFFLLFVIGFLTYKLYF